MGTKANEEETRKRVVGYAILVCIVLGVGVKFLVFPMINRIKAMQSQAVSIEKQLELTREMVRDEPKILAEFDESTMTLARIVKSYVPPADNPFAWASQHIYYVARQIDADVEKVTPQAAPYSRGIPEERAPEFVPYGVRVQVSCSFTKGIQMIRVMEKSNPFLCISELNIVSQPNDPEHHLFSFVAEWPSEAPPRPPAAEPKMSKTAKLSKLSKPSRH